MPQSCLLMPVTNVRGTNIRNSGRAHLAHDHLEFRIQHFQNRLDAGLTKGSKTPDIGAPNTYGVSTQGERLENIGAAPETAID